MDPSFVLTLAAGLLLLLTGLTSGRTHPIDGAPAPAAADHDPPANPPEA